MQQQLVTSHLIHPYVNLDPNVALPVPQFATPVPQVDAYGSMMLFCLINNIQANAEQSSLRRLFFNRTAVNGFNNDFMNNKVYKSAMAWLSAKCAMGQVFNVNDLRNDVQQAAGEIVSAMAANQINEFQGLLNEIPPQYHQVVWSDAQGYAEISQAVNAHMQQAYNSAAGIGSDGRYSAAAMFGGGQSPRPVQQAPQTVAYGGRPAQSSISQYRQAQQPPGAIQSGGTAVGSRYTDGSMPDHQQQQQQAQRPPQHPNPSSHLAGAVGSSDIFNDGVNNMKENRTVDQQNPSEVLEDGWIIVKASESDYVWKPSEQQRYFPAYAPSKSELYLKINPQTGVVIAMPRPMDYDEHSIPNLARVTASSFDDKREFQQNLLDPRLVNDQLEDANERVAQDSKNHKVIQELTETGAQQTTVHRSLDLVAHTEDSVWHKAAILRARVKDAPKIFRTYAVVSAPIVGAEDQTFIDVISNKKTYAEVRQVILDNAESVHPEVLAMVNRYMTRVINDVLKCELSLKGWKMDSFVTDYPELEEKLRAIKGDVIANAFADGAYDTIEAAFQEVNEETKSALTAGLLGDTDDEVAVTFITHIQSLTLIDLLAVELDIQLSNEFPSQLRSSEHPHLYKLVKDLYQDERVDGYSVYQNLIRTKDGVILKLTRGLLGNESYQLTIVEK